MLKVHAEMLANHKLGQASLLNNVLVLKLASNQSTMIKKESHVNVSVTLGFAHISLTTIVTIKQVC